MSSLALTGFSGRKLLTAADAGPCMQQLSTEVSAALAAKVPGKPWNLVEKVQTRFVTTNDGKCSLAIGTLRSDEELTKLACRWKTVTSAIKPVLKDAGFKEVTQEDVDAIGGWTRISSTDETGGLIGLGMQT